MIRELRRRGRPTKRTLRAVSLADGLVMMVFLCVAVSERVDAMYLPIFEIINACNASRQ